MALISHGRYVPGPAGLLKRLQAENATPAAIQAALNEALRPQHAACSWSRVLPAVNQDLGAAYPSWASACTAFDIGPADAAHPMLAHDIASILKHSKTHKVPQLLAVVQSLENNPTGGAHIILKDRSGTLKATVHPQVLEQQPNLMAGATLALRQVTVVCALPAMVCLVITSDNISSSGIFVPPAAMTQPNHQQPPQFGHAAQTIPRERPGGQVPGLAEALRPDSPPPVAPDRMRPAAVLGLRNTSAHTVRGLQHVAAAALPGPQPQGQQQNQQQQGPSQQQCTEHQPTTLLVQGVASQLQLTANAAQRTGATGKPMSAAHLLHIQSLHEPSPVLPTTGGGSAQAASADPVRLGTGQPASVKDSQMQRLQRLRQQSLSLQQASSQSSVDQIECTPQLPGTLLMTRGQQQAAAAAATGTGGCRAATTSQGVEAGTSVEQEQQQQHRLAAQQQAEDWQENMEDAYDDDSCGEDEEMPQFTVLGVLPAKRRLQSTTAPSHMPLTELQHGGHPPQLRAGVSAAKKDGLAAPTADSRTGSKTVQQTSQQQQGQQGQPAGLSATKYHPQSFVQGQSAAHPSALREPLQPCVPTALVAQIPNPGAFNGAQNVSVATAVSEELSMLSGSGKRPRLLSAVKDYLQKPLTSAASTGVGAPQTAPAEKQAPRGLHSDVTAGTRLPQEVSLPSSRLPQQASVAGAVAGVVEGHAAKLATKGAAQLGPIIGQQQLQAGKQTVAPARPQPAVVLSRTQQQQQRSLPLVSSMGLQVATGLTASQMRASGGARPQLNLANDDDDVELCDDED